MAASRKKTPRQLRLFSPPFRPSREQRKRGLRGITRIREQLERTKPDPESETR